MKKLIPLLLALCLLLTACGAETTVLEDTDAPLAAAMPTMAMPTLGDKQEVTTKASIDYSHTSDGYVMAKFNVVTEKRLKVQVVGPNTTYTYNLDSKGSWEVFPLSDGEGNYTIKVFEQTQGTKYAVTASKTLAVSLKNEFAPFILPNQYVNYSSNSSIIAKANELVKGKTTELDKVAAIYDFMINNFTYDKELAQSVQSGYLPNLEAVLSAKKGICFDYAALMTGMLRSQGIPTKLVVGYTGDVYHAWINVYTEASGWIDSVVQFNGDEWKLMDPTFASTGKNSQSVKDYIGNGSNYQAKYLY